jgi:hypothetical protein
MKEGQRKTDIRQQVRGIQFAREPRTPNFELRAPLLLTLRRLWAINSADRKAARRQPLCRMTGTPPRFMNRHKQRARFAPVGATMDILTFRRSFGSGASCELALDLDALKQRYEPQAAVVVGDATALRKFAAELEASTAPVSRAKWNGKPRASDAAEIRDWLICANVAAIEYLESAAVDDPREQRSADDEGKLREHLTMALAGAIPEGFPRGFPGGEK